MNKGIKWKTVSKYSLEEMKEYLELDFVPTAVWVEDWGDEEIIETLLIQYSDGTVLYEKEVNRNLYFLTHDVIYEEMIE